MQGCKAVRLHSSERSSIARAALGVHVASFTAAVQPRVAGFTQRVSSSCAMLRWPLGALACEKARASSRFATRLSES